MGLNNKLDVAGFIARAKSVHGSNWYDYSQVQQWGDKIKLTIICPQHGPFEQQGGSHLQGCGCPVCACFVRGITRRFTAVEFITKAQARHGVGCYDYSRVEYSTQATKVAIICPIHGEFEQQANNHLLGKGCPKCGRERTTLVARQQIKKPVVVKPVVVKPSGRSNDGIRQAAAISFIGRARAKHGSRYDYSEAIYTGSTKKLTIICPAHGAFEQTPANHVRGHNCPQCADRTSNAACFIEGSRKVHGETYNYSRVSYINGATKVAIICPIHGEFEQKPNSHLCGSGCWPCANERIREGWVKRAAGRECTLYLVRFYDKTEQFFKVGITCRGVKARFATARLRGYKRETLAVCNSHNAARIFEWEQSILKTFAHLRYKPIRPFAGETECFTSCEEILSIFPL